MTTLYFTKTIQRCTVVSLLLITGYRIRTIYYLYCYPQTCSICCPNIRDATHASFTKIVSQFIALWINWITPLIGFNLQKDDFAEWKNWINNFFILIGLLFSFNKGASCWTPEEEVPDHAIPSQSRHRIKSKLMKYNLTSKYIKRAWSRFCSKF